MKSDWDKTTYPLRGYDAWRQLPYGDHNVIAYISEEVRRQGDSPWHVYRMWSAWQFATLQRIIDPQIYHSTVRAIGKMIDEANENGYRDGPVWIGGDLKNEFIVHDEMQQLLSMQHTLSPDIFYKEFERIHPFFDGNGRTGKVLFNWLNNTLDNPVWPPDFFGGIENP